MEIVYNFNSIVALGNFNPAIASPEFLKEICGLDLGELLDQSNPNIPVHKTLQFKTLKLIVDLDKLRIIDQHIEDISKTKVINIFDAYYSKLSHTPLRAVGFNINCELITNESEERDGLLEKISNPKTYMDFFGAKEITVTQNFIQTSDSSAWIKSNYHIENIRGLTRHITADQKKDSFTLNYNYEAGNLDRDKSKLKLFFDECEDFFDEFNRFLKHLED